MLTRYRYQIKFVQRRITAEDTSQASVSTETQTAPRDSVLTNLTGIANIGTVIRGYFPSAEVETITENWSYELTQLIGEMGGSIGLFLGFSFLFIYTGTEVVWLAITRALYKAKPVVNRGDMTWIKSGKMKPAVSSSH